MDDTRFAKFSSDPKFRRIPKKEKKVKIDSRFKSVFTNKKFSTKVAVDKRGRPETYSSKETFEKFYDIGGGSSSSEDEASDDEKPQKDDKIRDKLNDMTVDYARGQANLLSDSSSEEDSDDEEEGEYGVFDKWGELDHDAERTEDITKRLAVCNLDWDRVDASDLYLALSSFCPKGATLESVRIYLSKFGQGRLAEEETLGPAELRKQEEDEEKEEEEVWLGDADDSVDAKTMEKIRMYQINRLKYYYGVATFHSAEAANCVYESCDGAEYELSATRFDLRFIPDEMEFDSEDLKDECLTAPDAETYKPKIFKNTALMQGKVNLTWDETDPKRSAAMKRAFDNVDEDDETVMGLIAGASSEEESENEVAENQNNMSDNNDTEISSDDNEDDAVEKYKALLADIAHKEKKKKKSGFDESGEESGDKGGMEVKFTMDKDDDDVDKSNMTPWEQYLHKKKKKRNKKRLERKKALSEEDVSDENDFFIDKQGEERKNKKKKVKKQSAQEEEKKDLSLLAMDSDDDKKHFDYKEIVKQETMNKRKKKKLKKRDEGSAATEDNFAVNLDDDRFGAIFDSAAYNIDPSHPNFKKTKSMQAIVDEKQKRIISGKRRKSLSGNVDEAEKVEKKKVKVEKTSPNNDSLDRLVHKIKSKSNVKAGFKNKKSKIKR